MRHVHLYTNVGGFVTAGQIPPFLPGLEAEVIFWGSRVFLLRRRPDGAPVVERDDAFVYREVFAVALVIPSAPAQAAV